MDEPEKACGSPEAENGEHLWTAYGVCVNPGCGEPGGPVDEWMQYGDRD